MPVRTALLITLCAVLSSCTQIEEAFSRKVAVADSRTPILTQPVVSKSETDPTLYDLVTEGERLYLSWNAESGAGSTLSENPITIAYTTDGTVFTRLPGNFANSSNECTVPIGATGCLPLANPGKSGQSLFFQITVTNSLQFSAVGDTNLINASGFNFLAGSTRTGENTNFADATLNPVLGQALAVDSSEGVSYILDRRGLLVAEQRVGSVRMLIPTTGTATASSLEAPTRIALEYAAEPQRNTLLIRDAHRILRFDPASATFLQLVDGLTPESSLTHQGILTALPDGGFLFGDKFDTRPVDGAAIHWRRPDGSITSILPHGLATIQQVPNQDAGYCYLKGASVVLDLNNPSAPIARLILLMGPRELFPSAMTAGVSHHCYGFLDELNSMDYVELDPNSGETVAASVRPPPPVMVPYTFNLWGFREFRNIPTTGMNGNLYLYGTPGEASYNAIARLNSGANIWQAQVSMTGTLFQSNQFLANANGYCADASAPTSCAISAQSVFVDEIGTLYFLDGGRLRVVLNGNQVLTIVGKGSYFGDNGRPLDAKLGEITFLETWNDGTDHFVLADFENLRIREFTENGTIYTVTGTGTRGQPGVNMEFQNNPPTPLASTVNLRWQKDASFSSFAVDGEGNIFTALRDDFGVYKVVRRFQSWVPAETSGYGPLAGYGPQVFGRKANGTLLVGTQNYCGIETYPSAGGQCNTNVYEVDTTQSPAVRRLIVGSEQGYGSLNAFCRRDNLNQCVAPPEQGWESGLDYSGPSIQDHSMPHAQVDPQDGGWLVKSLDIGVAAGRQGKKVTKILNGQLQTFTSFEHFSQGFALVGSKDFYYCSSEDGNLYRHEKGNTGDQKLSFPLSNMKCAGAVTYSPSRNSLVFVYRLNEQNAIAEKKL